MRLPPPPGSSRPARRFSGRATALAVVLLGLVVPDPATATDLADVGADELLLFEDLPIVVTASRQPQPVGLASMPVLVVTAEDIRYSGASTIAEALELLPGIDAARFDRNRHAVGVRGLHEVYSDRTLTLVDGAVVDDPTSGGGDFSRLAISLADVERIEVIRGPGGAAWGANAFNGVIHVITRDPEKTRARFASTRVSGFGDAESVWRWSDRSGPVAWRMTGALETRRPSTAALDRDDLTSSAFAPGTIPFDPSGLAARDDGRAVRLDGAGSWRVDDRTRLRFGAGYAEGRWGQFERLGVLPTSDIRTGLARVNARLDRRLAGGGSVSVQARTRLHRDRHPGSHVGSIEEYDTEFQVERPWGGGHLATVGGTLGTTRLRLDRTEPEGFDFPGSPYREHETGAFLVDRWAATDRLTFEGQARLDWYSPIGTDWSGRGTALAALDRRGTVVLRAGVARAFRTPLVSLRELTGGSLPLGPDLYLFEFRPSAVALENEETRSLETGLHWTPDSGGVLRVDAYRQTYERLVGYRVGEVGPPFRAEPANLDGATAWGVEIEYARHWSAGRASVWYGRNAFRLHDEDQVLRAFPPSPHKAGTSLRWRPTERWTGQVQYRWSDRTEQSAAFGPLVSEAAHRVDLVVARGLDAHGTELLVGVLDLLDEEGRPIGSVGSLTMQEVPGRRWFVQLVLAP